MSSIKYYKNDSSDFTQSKRYNSQRTEAEKYSQYVKEFSRYGDYNKRDVRQAIVAAVTQADTGPSTKRSKMMALRHLAIESGGLKVDSVENETLFDLQKVYTTVALETEQKHERSAKELETFIPYEEIEEMDKNLEQLVWSGSVHDYNKLYKLRQQWLLMSTFVYMAPLRLNLSHCRLMHKPCPEGAPSSEHVGNAIERDGDGSFVIVINHDKVTGLGRHQSGQRIKVHPVVKQRIDVMDELYPERLYLLTKSQGPMMFTTPLEKSETVSKYTTYQFIRSIPRDSTGSPSKLHINGIRSAVVTKYYDGSPSESGKEDLAKRMRTSVNTSSLYYKK